MIVYTMQDMAGLFVLGFCLLVLAVGGVLIGLGKIKDSVKHKVKSNRIR